MSKLKQNSSHWTNEREEDVHTFEQAIFRCFKLKTQQIIRKKMYLSILHKLQHDNYWETRRKQTQIPQVPV